MSFEDIQKIRELQERVKALEDAVQQLKIEQHKRTLSLPVKEKKSN